MRWKSHVRCGPTRKPNRLVRDGEEPEVEEPSQGEIDLEEKFNTKLNEIVGEDGKFLFGTLNKETNEIVIEDTDELLEAGDTGIFQHMEDLLVKVIKLGEKEIDLNDAAKAKSEIKKYYADLGLSNIDGEKVTLVIVEDGVSITKTFTIVAK